MARPKREDGKNSKSVASNKWNEKAYWRFTVSVKKSCEDMLKDRCEELGITVSQYINFLIEKDIKGFESIGEKTKKGDKRK